MQDIVEIGNVLIPIIREENGTSWYPITYIYEKVLLRQKKVSQSFKKNYKDYVGCKTVDFTWITDKPNIQKCNCISEDGLVLLIDNMYHRSFSKESMKGLNNLREYLHMDKLDEDIYVVFDKEQQCNIIKNYNIYIQDCIKEILKSAPNIKWFKCNKCGNYYPYHENFYEVEYSSKLYTLKTVCRDCQTRVNKQSHSYMKHIDDRLENIYSIYGEKVYNIYKNNNPIEIYKHWKSNDISKHIPKEIQNKESYLEIIKHYYDDGFFTNTGITQGYIQRICHMNINTINLNIGIVIKYCNGINDSDDLITYDNAIHIFNNYLYQNNIIIKDKFEFPYYQIIEKSSLKAFLKRCCDNTVINFIMKYWNYEYPAYKFKGVPQRYYSNKENLIRDIKYLIEKDMKIPINKIPLYLTRNNLDKYAPSLCRILRKGTYGTSLFEWVNECYPNKFIEADFSINPYRNEFDSLEESQIHDILHSVFNNVIYNQRNTDRTISIDGMIPDWFVFTNKGCYIIEYFGLYVSNKSNNKRINDYIHRTNEKIEKYKQLNGYKSIFIFPKDLNNNYEGVYTKIKEIV